MSKRFYFELYRLNQLEALKEIPFKPIWIERVSSLQNPSNHSLLFCLKWENEYNQKLKPLENCLLILPTHLKNLEPQILAKNQIIMHHNPRLCYAQILQYILTFTLSPRLYKQREGNIVIGEGVTIGEGTTLEPFVFIDHDSVIGKNCTIKTGAKIRSDVVIGDDSIIGENAVIGGQGLGVEKDETGKMYRIPHLGGVRIGNRVEIGSLTSVLSGTIEPTLIGDDVIIDDLNHIAHNCKVGAKTMTAGCVELSGSVILGENCYIAPNALIRNQTKVGDNCFIGQGAVVTKDLPDNSKVAGNPAMPIEELKALRKLQKALIEEK